MKKYLITLLLIILCGCENKHIVENEIKIINQNININEEIYLYDIFDKNSKIISENYLIDTNTLGKKTITIKYLNNKNEQKSLDVNINIVDSIPPVIFCSNSYSIEKGMKTDIISKIIVGDNYDRNVKVELNGTYDINTIGEYNLTVISIDSSNNKTTKDIKIIVKDKIISSLATTTKLSDIISNYKNDNTIVGIDVSKWQGTINWDKVKKDGIDFAMIRIGSRNSKKEISIDPYYTKNIVNAKKAGLKVGIYFYSYAENINESLEEAKWVIKNLKGEKLDLPIAFDWEIWSKFNTYKLNFKDLNDMALSFFSEINKNNYDGIIYGSKNYLEYAWNLKEYKTWLAHYTNRTNYSKDYYIWQLCNNSRVDGINGNVDLNILYK